jgi:flavin reductase (DIM6/NTAB) family NADH-FMN oxidoreductase RutF
MTIDPRAFRNALGCFATGITVVTTTCPDGHPVGVTVNSFSSVSLDPPLVLFSLGRASQAYEFFVQGAAFAVNILAADQEDLSGRFSRRDLQERWDGVGVERWDTGVPILTGCLATIECDRHAVHDGGDHAIIVGRVRRLASTETGKPLLYFRGSYAQLG